MTALVQFFGVVVHVLMVDEGDIITAGGVSSAIDAGLHLVERLAGPDARLRIRTPTDCPHKWKEMERAAPARATTPCRRRVLPATPSPSRRSSPCSTTSQHI